MKGGSFVSYVEVTLLFSCSLTSIFHCNPQVAKHIMTADGRLVNCRGEEIVNLEVAGKVLKLTCTVGYII